MELNAGGWLQVITLGAVIGAAGQAARMIIGLKKLSDAAAHSGKSTAEYINASRLMISLVIGAVAGIIGTLTMDIDLTKNISANTLGTLIAIGYAGTDFIEGFMHKAQPGIAPAQVPSPSADTPGAKKTPTAVALPHIPVIKLPGA